MPSMVCISVMLRAELRYGLKRLPAEHRLHLAVRQFLKIVRTLPWDAEAADWYAEIRHQLISTEQPIGALDMMIAAHALSAGITSGSQSPLSWRTGRSVVNRKLKESQDDCHHRKLTKHSVFSSMIESEKKPPLH